MSVMEEYVAKREALKPQPKEAPKRRRNSKLTLELIEEIATAVAEDHVRPAAAAAVAGVSRFTFNQWLKRGKQDSESDTESIYRELAEAWEHAEGLSQMKLVREAQVNAGKNSNHAWKMHMDILRLRHPEWRDKQEVEHSGSQTIQIIVEGRPPRDPNYKPALADDPVELPALPAAASLPQQSSAG